MSKKEQEQVKEEELQQEETQTEAQNAEVESQNAEEEQPAKEETPEDKIAALQAELEKSQKEYLFLMAEFDNYRKRTVKEKAELIKNGGEKAVKLGGNLAIFRQRFCTKGVQKEKRVWYDKVTEEGGTPPGKDMEML